MCSIFRETAMNPPRKPTIGTSGPPGHANLEEDQLERELDEALLETFPASDPPAPAQPGKK